MKALILFLSFVVAGYSTAYTASVTGDWSNPATFGGAGTPGAGDTITINDGIVLSCTDARTIGTDPGNDSSTAAIQVNGTSGTGVLVVQTGCHLTVQGSVLMGDSAWYITPGTWVTHHASSGTGYSWKVGQIANKHARLYVGKTYPGGVTNSLLRVTMDNDNTSIPAIGFAPATNLSDAGDVESYYADWSYWGIAGKWFIRSTPVTLNQDTFITHSTFDHCGAIALPASTSGSDVLFTYNRITNSVLTTADGNPSQSLLVLSNNAAPAAGVTRSFWNNYIEGAVYWNSGNFTVATTATASSGGTVLAVASATGILVGNVVNGNGVTPLSTVTAINGTNITISLPTWAAMSGTAVRFAKSNGFDVHDNAVVSNNPFQYWTSAVASSIASYVASWTDNVIWDQSVGGNDNGSGGAGCYGGLCQNTVSVMSSAANVGGGPYCITYVSVGIDVVHDGWIFQTDVPNAGEGDCIVPSGTPTVMQNVAVKNSIYGIPRDGLQPTNWWTGVGTEANYTYWSEHNTIPQSTSNNTRFGFGHGWELSSGHAGIFERIASNLMWGIGVVGRAGIVWPNSAAIANYPPADGSFNGVDYNGWYNFPSGPYDTTGVTYGFTAAKFTSPSPPGTNDVNADPRFRDLTRNPFTWPSAALGYTATDGLWSALPSGAVAAGTLVANQKSDMFGGAYILYSARRTHDKATLLSEPGASTFRGAYSAGATYVAGDLILDSTATSNTTSHLCILTGAAPGTALSNTTYFAVDPTGTLGWRYYWEPYTLTLLRTMLPADTKIGGMSPIRHLIEWMRAGYTSTNLSYARKGHDAADIGLPIRVYNAPGITGGGVY